MSASEEVKLVQLTVRAEDIETELFVIDGGFRLLVRGVGSLDTQLEPGLYKLKCHAGGATQEQHIVLRDAPVSIYISRFAFASPVPLSGTSMTHEYQMDMAQRESRNVHCHAGQGSWIFVFARDWTSRTGQSTSTTRPPISWNPATGLALRDQLGNLVADLGALSVTDLSGDPCAACNVELNAGVYRLHLELPRREGAGPTSLEQTIVASPGWQTQVFLLQRAYGGELSDWRADLPGASILLSRDPGFDVSGPDSRQTELARLSIACQRKIVSQEIREMLRRKLKNPMLGILGMHLLLQNQESDTELLQTIVHNLRNLLVDPHPDVEALALPLEQTGSYLFQSPPMMRRSWSLVVNATAVRAELIPAGSLAAEIWKRLWGGEMWLIWRAPDGEVKPDRGIRYLINPVGEFGPAVPGPQGGVEAAAETDEMESVLEAHLRPLRRTVRRPLTSPFAAVTEMASVSDEGAFAERAQALAAGGPAQDFASSAPEPPMDAERMNALVRIFGIPKGNLEELIKKAYGEMRITGASE